MACCVLRTAGLAAACISPAKPRGARGRPAGVGMIFRAVVVLALAAVLAAFTYLRLERTGRRGWVPLACRAVAWGALGLLLLNVSCPVAGTIRRPLVLLDASLSLTAPGGRWREARDSAARWGDVRRFGDERGSADTLPTRGRSLLAPALTAASASDRPVLVVTDGEIEDAADIPPDLLQFGESYALVLEALIEGGVSVNKPYHRALQRNFAQAVTARFTP